MIKITKIWTARETVAKIDESTNVTITGSAALDTFFSAATSIEVQMKDITITEPSSEVDQIDLLGEDSNGFQNVEGEEKPYGMVEISGTGILPGDEIIEPFVYDSTTTVSTTHTRYQRGNGTRKRISLLLNLDDGTDEVNIVADNGWFTVKETSVTGADGHYEISWTLKCLARDFFVEFKD